MTSWSPAGALLGAGVGAGIIALSAVIPLRRRPSLELRLAPYLRDRPRPSALLDAERRPVTPFPALERIFWPVLADLGAAVERRVGGSASVRRRLEQAGSRLSVEQFRIQQVLATAAGAAAGAAVLAVREGTGRGPAPVVGAALTLLLAVAGAVGRGFVLGRAVTRRSTAIAAELPTLAELLALAVAAGEGPVNALDRVVRAARGELSGEIGRALADARAGQSLVAALRGVANRSGVPNVGRFVDGLSVAVERGTPLAEVLRAQAVDAREAGRRALLEAGGRKEIAMLVPVVFLVLPIVVLFSLYPAAVGISTIAH